MNISFTDQEILKLKMLNISALILFGSQAQGVANDASDFDIFVIGKKTASAYDFVYEIISEKINKLINLDIVLKQVPRWNFKVMWQSMDRYYIKKIIQYFLILNKK